MEDYNAYVVEGEWKWPCALVEVIDGDTMDLRIDRGFNDRTFKRVRLLGVDTAEIFGVEKESTEYQTGMRQKQFVEEWFDVDDDSEFPFTLHTYQSEGKFGRWLGDISYNGNSIGEAILDEWPNYHY